MKIKIHLILITEFAPFFKLHMFTVFAKKMPTKNGRKSLKTRQLVLALRFIEY